MTIDLPQLPFLRYTFFSLQFCATPVTTWRGAQFITAVNRWYVPFIKSGWAVPLSLTIDLATLLLNSTEIPQNFADGDDPEPLKQLSQQYQKTLNKLRHTVEFQFVAELVRTTSEPARQSQVIKTFLEITFSAIAGMKNIYSFDSRDLRLEKAAMNPRERKLGCVTRIGDDPPKRSELKLLGANVVAEIPEGRAVQEVLRLWCEFFEHTLLSEILTPDLRLVLELTATTAAGKGRVDYSLLNWLLPRPALDDVEEEEPSPRLVDEEEPTNPFQVEGQTGGYIDVQRRKFSGNMGEVLPIELGLWRVKPLMLQKLLNEGMLTYVRENFEFIDRELRVLFCFIVDNHPQMLLTRPDTHPDLPKGLSPYTRARALAARMIQDVSRFLPRIDVFPDCGLFLWSEPDGRRARNHVTSSAEVDLFGLSQKDAGDQTRFLRHLISCNAELFYSKLGANDRDVRPHLEIHPDDYIRNRDQRRHYHCRHIVLLTSEETRQDLVSGLDTNLIAGDFGPDSVMIIDCGVTDSTVAAQMPNHLDDEHPPTHLGETDLRVLFLESVLCKAAGKPPSTRVTDLEHI